MLRNLRTFTNIIIKARNFSTMKFIGEYRRISMENFMTSERRNERTNL